MKSLGLIEVIGYPAAIEAADSALKAANVNLVGIKKVDGGIMTVQITGDVGAVKSAVDAAEVSAALISTVRGAHVIPRVHEEILSIIPEMDEKKPTEIEKDKADKIEEKDDIEQTNDEIEVRENSEELIDLDNVEEVQVDIQTQVVDKKEDEKSEKNLKVEISKESLSSMSVKELKKLAMSLDLAMTPKKIKSCKKDELISLLIKHSREGDK